MKITRSGLSLMLLPACLLCCQTAAAWQQEYSGSDKLNVTAERYIWDSDRQPRYNDVLEERIRSTQNLPGVAFNLPDETPLDSISTMSIGLNIPLASSVTTGPVAAWHYDGSMTSMYNEFGDSATTIQYSDPLWHASVSSLGWRVNSRFGDLRPWAQLSFNQQFGENVWKSQSGLYRLTAANQYGNWMDVTLGADMLLNPHLAAYAAMSQSENATFGQNYLYSMGVSARF
ncbi:autotransporter outer membrane beta-barrel domain-containing protein [Kosakonia quasisacchari]|uniref:Autotransporter outer membrane beta-barrel domain-containing protein n=1 Tax=Kosakonia quasisacchari TaxID=2529380 RepID=A0A4R0GYA3_9ENTR|nr:autotransporter domain-containing protein [Kosakonia quasisacchari]TCC03115.1 autotransporter outer membrane beta-barrel domain-containing protein [Kosakonia quasisacchari]